MVRTPNGESYAENSITYLEPCEKSRRKGICVVFAGVKWYKLPVNFNGGLAYGTWRIWFILGWHHQIDGAGVWRYRYQPNLYPDGHFCPDRANPGQCTGDSIADRLDPDHPRLRRIRLARHESGAQGRRWHHCPQ